MVRILTTQPPQHTHGYTNLPRKYYSTSRQYLEQMPADQKVSVAWQIVFTFITGLNFWAFYRIRKLRTYLAYLYGPSVAVMFAIVAVFLYATDIYKSWVLTPTWQDFTLAASYLFMFALINVVQFTGFSIHLVVKWSREHNQK